MLSVGAWWTFRLVGLVCFALSGVEFAWDGFGVGGWWFGCFRFGFDVVASVFLAVVLIIWF